jgi:hypothetical protein
VTSYHRFDGHSLHVAQHSSGEIGKWSHKDMDGNVTKGRTAGALASHLDMVHPDLSVAAEEARDAHGKWSSGGEASSPADHEKAAADHEARASALRDHAQDLFRQANAAQASASDHSLAADDHRMAAKASKVYGEDDGMTKEFGSSANARSAEAAAHDTFDIPKNKSIAAGGSGSGDRKGMRMKKPHAFMGHGLKCKLCGKTKGSSLHMKKL